MMGVPPSNDSLEGAIEQVFEVRQRSAEPDERVDSLLEIGVQSLNVENAHLKRVDSGIGTQQVIASVGRTELVETGDFHHHERTYCRHTVEQETPLALHHASEQGFEDDPAYRAHDLECYLGVPVYVGGTVYGTVCFVSVDPRTEPFDPAEQGFVELIARSISQELAEMVTDDELSVKSRALEEASVAASIADATNDPATFVYTNRAFETLTGYSREKLRGETLEVLHGPETEPEALVELKAALEDGKTQQTEVCFHRADGSSILTLVSVTPVTDRHGAVTHYIAFYQNITLRRNHERLVAVLNRVLRHNLRNRLSVVEGYTENLQRAGAGDSEVLDRITGAVEDLIDLSHEAKRLESVRERANDPREIDIGPVVVDTAAELRSTGKPAHVETVVEGETTILGTVHVEDALKELGENALEHAGPAPEIRLAVEPVEGESFVAVEVRDDGPGLPEHEQATLEGRVETQIEHGSGLGLFLVYWTVTSLGGSIAVSAEEGTTVRLFLPTLASESVPSTPAEVLHGE